MKGMSEGREEGIESKVGRCKIGWRGVVRAR